MRKSLVLAMILATLVTGCQGQPVTPTPTPTPTAQTTVLKLRAVLASIDLTVGKNQIVFALVGPTSAPVRASAADVTLSYSAGDTIATISRLEAVFHGSPAGPGGVFTFKVDLPKPGEWLAEISPRDGEAAGEKARVVIRVPGTLSAPSLGSQHPSAKIVPPKT